MNIYLIRHGQKENDEKNYDTLMLTKKGVKQANLVGKRLSIYNIKKIYTSDMARAIQTSNVMNKYLNVEIVIRSELREINMGECDSIGWEYVFDTYPEFKREFEKHEIDISYPKGECGEDVLKRAKKIIDEILASGLDNIAVVTHGGVIRVLISSFLGLSQARRFYFGAPLENCSISIIIYNKDKKEFHVHCVNDYAHLEALEG